MEDTQGTLGARSLIVADERKRIKPNGLRQVVDLMWSAIEKKGLPSKGNLSIVLLAGEETGIDRYLSGKRELTTKVKEDSQ